MRKVATFIGRRDIALRAAVVLAMGVFMIALAIGTVAANAVLGVLVSILALVLLVLAVITFLRYVRLVVDLRKAILGTG